MRISDLSSDVCSSDLRGGVAADLSSGHGRHLAVAALRIARCGPRLAGQDGTDAAPVGRRPAVSVIAETRPAATRIAIYDLDRTVLRKPTFTLFLLWAAWRAAPWRLLLLPALVGLGIGTALRLYGQDPIKPAARRMITGPHFGLGRDEWRER